MTVEAARLWKAAVAAAQEWQHDDLGTEHLLLGLLADPTNDAARLLAQQGVSAEALREQVASMLQRDEPTP